MRIAFIVSDYPPVLGGISRYTGDVVRFLARVWPVDVYCLSDVERATWPPHPHRGYIKPREFSENPLAVAKQLANNQTSHVFINHIDMVAPRTVAAFRKAGLPMSVFIYGADISLARGLRSYLRMYRTAAGMAHRIVISEGTRNIFRRRLPGLSCRMILPGITAGPEIPAREGPGDGIIAVGRFVRRKGFDTLLDAVARLERSGQKPRVTLVGDGPDRDWLAERCRQLKLDNRVRFLSGLSDEAIRTELQSHRVFCLLPRELENGDVEGFGIVFLEAAREGLPVVAGRSGGVPDAVKHNGNGFLVDPCDPDDAARQLQKLLTDDALWQRQSAESLRWYRTFDWTLREPRREFAFIL